MMPAGEPKAVLEPWQGKLPRWYVWGGDRRFLVYAEDWRKALFMAAKERVVLGLDKVELQVRQDAENAPAKLLTEEWWKA